MSIVHLHLVSDSTGETVHSLGRACAVQFESVDIQEHLWPLTRSNEQIDAVLQGVKKNPGLVLYSLVEEDVRKTLDDGCREQGVPTVSVLDPIFAAFANHLGLHKRGLPGRQHVLDEEYFQRIDAMQFALAHDDGQGVYDIDESDVILTGVSRTSKSPTCIYLANRGVKAANVPYVPGIALPEELLALKGENCPLIVGLTKDPAQLVQIRRNRLRMIEEHADTDYVDLETVREEVSTARRFFNERGWPIIDVSRRSIEETAAAILQKMEQRQSTKDE